MSEVGEMVGPGDNPDQRLINSLQVRAGSTLRLEDGDGQRAVFLDITSRSLGDHREVRTESFGMTVDQAAWLAGRLVGVVSELGEGAWW